MKKDNKNLCENENLFVQNFESNLTSQERQRTLTRTQMSHHFDESMTMKKSDSITRSPCKDDKSPSAFNS